MIEMRKVIPLVIILTCFSSVAFAQDKTASSIQDAVNEHLSVLTSSITGYDNIFIATKMDDQLLVPQKVWKIENVLNAKLIKRKAKNYLVVIRIGSQSEYLKLDLINYSA
jgi:hypothetical protein